MADGVSDPFRAARLLLVLRREGVTDDGVLRAVETVDRGRFIPPEFASLAYEDCRLPIGCGQSLYSPVVAGRLLQALRLQHGAGQSVLIIGSGSGYTMALAGQMAERVAGIDRYAGLVNAANRALSDAPTSTRFDFYHGDGLRGLAATERFDRILIAGTIEAVPAVLLQNLHSNGRLVAPVRSGDDIVLNVFTSDGPPVETSFPYSLSPLVAGVSRVL